MYNLLIQPALEGDFTAETQVIFSPHKNYQEAGLILIGDDYNFFKIGRVNAKGDFCADCVGDSISLVQRKDGILMPSSNLKATDVSEIYLRFAVESNMITVFYSEDGARWEILNFDLLPWEPVSIGLYTLMGTEPDFEIAARFDYFAMQEGFTDIAMVIPVFPTFSSRRTPGDSPSSGGSASDTCFDETYIAYEYDGGPEVGRFSTGGCICDEALSQWNQDAYDWYDSLEAQGLASDVNREWIYCGSDDGWREVTHYYDSAGNKVDTLRSACIFSSADELKAYDDWLQWIQSLWTNYPGGDSVTTTEDCTK